MNSKPIIEKLVNCFKSFYGESMSSLIGERIKNLVDIIFYNNHSSSKELETVQEYLDITNKGLSIVENMIKKTREI